MRNWNFLMSPRWDFHPLVFTLPMRNWNSPKLGYLELQEKRFYFTYEELKRHDLAVGQHMSGLVFTLPMRNWNTRLICQRPSGKARFYFTYEELKHHSQSLGLFRLAGFLLYLWGIETLLWPLQSHSYCLFLLYLWGIETCWRCKWAAKTKSVFTLPMRNWNTIMSMITTGKLMSFYFTYEELKQRTLK